MNHYRQSLTRREFIQAGAAVGAGVLGTPLIMRAANQQEVKRTRPFGRTGFQVTTMGLGGQASLQWTPDDVDPVAIIVDAYRRGVNYFDTSNVYDDSQRNYGKAFRELGLVPGLPNYQEAQRRRVFVASKTMLRMAKGSPPPGRHVNATQGPSGSRAIDDLKRTLSQVFGDQRGEYADDAYLDLYQIHNLNHMREVDTIYLGLDKPDPAADQIGALAALRDYRDGTNLTGLNPREERRIRHLGITGHISSPVLMECIQRDEEQLLDTLLVAINANDRRYFNHQHNVIPVAAAKGMGLIAMKVFADGAMFGREPGWTHLKPEVVRTVGSDQLPSAPLVQYALSVPGISTAIIGIGQIDTDPQRCQLQQNLTAAQLEAPLAEGDLQRVEQLAASVRDGRTNYFQLAAEPLGAPRDAAAQQVVRGGTRNVRLSWQTAFASDAPITHYLVQRDGQQIARVPHKPQITKEPFRCNDTPQDRAAHAYTVVAVDNNGRTATTSALRVAALG
jgi:aryl-alcohol dehydrogenase-like predicted oxidoreductase